MLEEKRASTRVDFDDRILCYKHIITSSNIKPDPSPIQILIKDISYSGIGITCNRDLGNGDYLMFNLESAGVKKEFMMKVRWCRYDSGLYQSGLEFTSLTKDMLLFLDTLIKSHIRKQAWMGRSV